MMKIESVYTFPGVRQFNACSVTDQLLLLLPLLLQASLFKLYELTAIAAAACGAVDARLLELLAALAGEVSPGSSEHIFWARQYRWGGYMFRDMCFLMT
jgi:hypothetical protein